MKIVNIVFNFKKSTHDNKILGVERCFIDYAKHLIANGHEVFSVTKPNMIYKKDVIETGSKYLELSAFGQGDIFSILRLAKLFFTSKADVILCHSGRALFMARMARLLTLRRIPIIGIDHGIKPKKFMKADYVFTVNSYFSKKLVEAGKPANRALVIPNMIEIPTDFSPITKLKFHNPIRLGSLGRLYEEKSFDRVLHAMALLRERGIECEYFIGGVGPMEKPLNELAKKLGLEKNFKILGWTTDKKTFFESIDIFILPSWGETFGIVLLEAMLYSTPIITTNSWGPDEVIDHEIDGLKVSRDDMEAMPKALAEAIVRLNDNQDFAKKLAVKAFEKFVFNYSAKMVGKKLSDMITKVVEEFRA